MKRKASIFLMILLLLFPFLFAAGCAGEQGSSVPSENEAAAADSKMQEEGNTQQAPAAQTGTSTESAKTEPDKNGKTDKYNTEPVPEGMPEPVEPGGEKVDKKTALHCTFSIECSTILDNMDKLTEGKEELVPSDGVVLAAKEVEFYEGESVFDVLLRETRANKIHMEFVAAPIYNSKYIEDINNLYEFDCGPLSGWHYRVNGWYPNYGCSRYMLSDGDVVEWRYTCDLSRDIGGGVYE